MKHYLYRHIRLDKNVPFYIGIGTRRKIVNGYGANERAKSRTGRNAIWKRITALTEYEIEIIYESNDYEEIKVKEIEFVELYRLISEGGTLCNLTKGGEGTLGYAPTKETREKFKNKKLGHLNPNFGKKFTQSHRDKMSAGIRGKKRTDEQRERLRKSNWLQRPIICITNGKKYDSSAQAARDLFPYVKPKTARSHIAKSVKLNIPYKNMIFNGV
jgi:hypothetical protein